MSRRGLVMEDDLSNEATYYSVVEPSNLSAMADSTTLATVQRIARMRSSVCFYHIYLYLMAMRRGRGGRGRGNMENLKVFRGIYGWICTCTVLATTEEGPKSWEVADVEASMRRLMLSSRKEFINKQGKIVDGSGSGSSLNIGSGMPEDLINTLD
ncbi:hypothetical protein PHJA_001723200 [Phtheirospermum japonicum]|uniref:Uncharacterized protein n=1 Tax=Phtheirospermum japonicum TaxID=374723 RepID=A0A830C8B2_9LAMI|nr:hypothetical protein PHJA_001723200 [Phtheirospermum japonicum]